MKADQEIVADEQAQLRHRHVGRVGFYDRMRHNDEQLVVVLVDLRSLARVDHVLERQLVQAEQRAELAQGRRFGIPLDVNPGDRVAVEVHPALLRRRQVVLDEFGFGVIRQVQLQRNESRLAGALQGSRRRAGRVVALGEISHLRCPP